MRTRLTALTMSLMLCITSADAEACFPGYEFRMLFEKIPFALDAPVIARITGVEVLSGASKRDAVVLARIDKVIKGELEGEYIRLVYQRTSCGPSFPQSYVGASGIVLGKLERNDEGAISLRPTYDSRNHEMARWRKVHQ
jgi:hypothetical protein